MSAVNVYLMEQTIEPGLIADGHYIINLFSGPSRGGIGRGDGEVVHTFLPRFYILRTTREQQAKCYKSRIGQTYNSFACKIVSGLYTLKQVGGWLHTSGVHNKEA